MAQPAPGSTDLSFMLSTLTPILDEKTYVWCTIPPSTPRPADLPYKFVFEESEGTTVVTTEVAAQEHKLEFTFPCKMVTISVHSSLEAVGLLAAITTHVAKDVRVGVNAVSGFYHDHLFVPLGKETEVVESVQRLVEQSKETIA